jgi:hypothetical protein
MPLFIPVVLGALKLLAIGFATVTLLTASSQSQQPKSLPPQRLPFPPGGPTTTLPNTGSFNNINRNVYGTKTVSSGSGSPASTTTSAATSTAAPAPAPAPEPPPPPEPGPPPVYTGVKAAPIDTVVFVDEPFDPNYFEDVLFQDFGGQELLSVARNDTVNGQSVSYQPFKDLGIIRDQYSPNSLLSIQETSDRFFANFLIRLNEKIPEVGRGANGANYYLDTEGSAIIELINILDDEQVEIQVLNAGIIESIGI